MSRKAAMQEKNMYGGRSFMVILLVLPGEFDAWGGWCYDPIMPVYFNH